MAFLLRALPCLAVAVAVAPPLLMPTPGRRPAILPVRGAKAQTTGAYAREAAAPVASATANLASRLRGKRPALSMSTSSRKAEVSLLDALKTTSPALSTMYYEAQMLQLSETSNGNPSVAALLDVLEARHRAKIDENVLCGSWSLEYTGELPLVVQKEVARHLSDPVADLSIVASISGTGTLDTKAVIARRSGEEKVLKLPGLMLQNAIPPAFPESIKDGDRKLAEVTYMSKSVLVLRKYTGGQDDEKLLSRGFSHEIPKTEVWRKLGPSEDRLATGPASLWRFGLAYDTARQAQLKVQPEVSLHRVALASVVGSAIGILVLVIASATLGFDWRRRRCETLSHDAATEMKNAAVFCTALPADEKFAVAALSSESAVGASRARDRSDGEYTTENWRLEKSVLPVQSVDALVTDIADSIEHSLQTGSRVQDAAASPRRLALGAIAVGLAQGPTRPPPASAEVPPFLKSAVTLYMEPVQLAADYLVFYVRPKILAKDWSGLREYLRPDSVGNSKAYIDLVYGLQRAVGGTEDILDGVETANYQMNKLLFALEGALTADQDARQELCLRVWDDMAALVTKVMKAFNNYVAEEPELSGVSSFIPFALPQKDKSKYGRSEETFADRCQGIMQSGICIPISKDADKLIAGSAQIGMNVNPFMIQRCEDGKCGK